MKTFTVQYKGGYETFQAHGANEVRKLFKNWAIINGVRPIILSIT